MKRRIVSALFASLVACCALAADDPGSAARQLGADGNTKASAATSVDPSTYPGYQGAEVPERDYYRSGTQIETQARTTAPDSTAGNVVTTNVFSGPRFYFQNNDPLLQNSANAQSAGASLLANYYQGCSSLTVGSSGGNAAPATCYANAMQAAQSCSRTLTTSCPPGASDTAGIQAGAIASDMKWEYAFPTLTLGTTANNYWAGNCTLYDRTTTFTVENVTLLKSFRLTGVGFDDYLSIAVNDHVIFGGPYGGDMLAITNGRVQYDSNGATGPCELNRSWQQSANVDLRPFLVNGTNTIRMQVEVSGNGEGWMQIDAQNYPDCSANDQWVQHCESGTAPGAECRLQSSVCTEGAGTRTVDGVPQYRACWAYQDTYLCGSAQQQEEAACNSLRNQGCQQTASSCITHDSVGHCTRYQQSFRCPSASAPHQTVTLCGSDLYCQGGSCTSDVVTPAASDVTQMAAASTWLQAAQQAGLDNTNATGTSSFFAGDGMKCSTEALGFSNCCSDSGWGNDAGLAQCSEEEQQLGIAREAKRTHYVGRYETGSIFTTTHESYCSFTGLLSRLIQEQGRVQLGIGWGSAREPDCRALTPDEMSRLDLNAMDFSEFYAQALAQAGAGLTARETNAAIQQRLQQQIDAMAGGAAK